MPIPGAPLLDYDSRNIDGSNNGTLTDGQLLSLWKNLGSLGSSGDLVGTGSTRPTYRAIATLGQLNDLPAVQSPGGKILSATVTLNQPLTWAWVFQGNASGTQVVSGGNPSEQLATAGTSFSFYCGTSVDPGLTFAPNTWVSLIIKADGGSSSGTFNGTPFSMSNPSTDSNGAIHLFNNYSEGYPLTGFVARLIVWGAGAPSQADIASYLASVYVDAAPPPPPTPPSHDGYTLDIISGFSSGTRRFAPVPVGHAVPGYGLESPCEHPAGVAPPPEVGLGEVVGLGPLDYRAQAKSRVIIQYRQSTRLLGFIYALMDFCQEIDNVLLQIEPLDDIDLANNKNLAVTGELVGQLRELLDGNVVDDAQLRILIKARITRNTARATGPDILAILSQVFAAPIILTDYGGMAIGYAIGRVVTPDEAAVLNGGAGGTILARPMGVFVTQQFFDAGGDYFGFDDTPGAKGFGELNLAAPPGGALSEIF